MQIIRYKDLSDAKTLVEVEAGKALKDVIPIEDWSKYAILINGVKGDENHVLKESDLVAIRSIPGDWETVGDVFLGVITLGIYTAVQSYRAKEAAEKALKDLEKLKNQTRDGITNVPYLKGASNTVATGKTQPYIIGRHLFTPYILNAGSKNFKGYHTISGSYGTDSFYNVVLENGFAKQILESISCDDVQISQLLQGEPQENNASNKQFYFTEGSVFASADSYIEIAQDGQPFEHPEFNKKIIEQEPSSQLKKANADGYEDLYFTLEKNSKACDVCIMFNGLYYMNNEGTKSNREVVVTPYYSVDYAEKVANGVANPDATANWVSFNFKQVVQTTTTAVHEGRYEWNHNFSDSIVNQSWVNDTLAHKSEWAFKSGENIGGVPGATFDITFDRWEGATKAYINATWRSTITYNKSTQSNTFSYNQNRQLRFQAHTDFSFAERFDSVSGGYEQKKYPITVKLVCSTDKVSSGTDVSDCYVQYIHSYCYDVQKSIASRSLVDERIIGEREAAKSTLLALHIKSTLSNEDKLGKVNVITNGLAYIRNSQGWDLSKKVMTDNPASWLIEVLSSPTHRASMVSIADEIDLPSFGELYDYCLNNGIGVNMVLTKEQKKADVLESILTVCHASLYQNIYGKIAVAIDAPKENAIAVLNEQNLVSFQYEKEIALDVDGLRVKYIDADSDFQENSFVRMFDGGTEDDITENTVLREITLTGVTNYEQAMHHAYYMMAGQKLRPITAKAVVGAEGYFFTPLSKVKVQHPSLKVGLGNAVIKNILVRDGNIVGVELYDAVDVDSYYPYSFIIQCVGDDYVSLLTSNARCLFETDFQLSDGDSLELSNGENLTVNLREPEYRKRKEPLILSDLSALELSDGSELEVEFSKPEIQRSTELYFTVPIPLTNSVIPHKGDVLSYGYEIETVTRDMLVTEIQPNGTDKYTLTLIDYDEKVYHDTGVIPDYHPVITERKPLPNTPEGNIPLEVPPEIQTIEQVQGVASGVVSEEVPGIVADKTPKYHGSVSAIPSGANAGDWFTAAVNFYNGVQLIEKGKVYKYNGSTWSVLAASSENAKELMTALSDLLSVNEAGTGYFETVFANALVANDAFINKLAASVIELQQIDGNGGVIRSQNYRTSGGTSGWMIDYNGKAYFNEGHFFSGIGEMHTLSGSAELPSNGVHLLTFFKGEMIGNPHYPAGYTLKATEPIGCIMTAGNRLYTHHGLEYVTGDANYLSISNVPDLMITREHVQSSSIFLREDYYKLTGTYTGSGDLFNYLCYTDVQLNV